MVAKQPMEYIPKITNFSMTTWIIMKDGLVVAKSATTKRVYLKLVF
jgi:hypothetical protein